jgi:flagellar biosynthesis protein FlhF
MQVKKFEAKTMKEALEMVKNQLGPDAIILGARDNNKGFGLLGTTSVEVTAAISETKLRERQFAESRMREQDRERFRKIPAQQQRKFIEQSISRFAAPPAQARRLPTPVQYIDIDDDQPRAAGERVDDLLRRMGQRQTFVEPQPKVEAGLQPSAKRRIKEAARSAAEVFKNDVQEVRQVATPAVNDEVIRLKEELETLRRAVTQLNQTPSAGTHPGADYGLPYDLSFIFERLVGAGVLKENAAQILYSAQKEIPVLHMKNRNLVEAWVANHLLNETRAVANPFDGRVHVFTGHSSQGKTSTLVKLAGQLVVQQRKKVAIVTADVFKVGAVEQLRIFSQILNAGFAVVRSPQDWAKVLNDFAQADAILVDVPGLALKTPEELAQLRAVLPPAEMEAEIHFVQSVCSKDVDAIEVARRYAALPCTDIVMTHLDESLNHGIIHNLQKAVGWPLHSFGVGPRIPDDLEAATRERVLDLIFKISKNSESSNSERSR